MKFRVYGTITGSVLIGEYKANTKEEAIEKANNDPGANWMPSLCWQCAGEVELDDINEVVAEEME